MSVLAVESFSRPDSWDLPLFVHVLGAMTLVGATMLAVTSLGAAWRSGSLPLTRLGFRALLWGVIPAWLVMRLSAEWIADEEGLEDADLAWIDIGYMTAEPLFLLVIIATVHAGLAVRRAGREGGGGPSVGVRVATGLVGVALLAYLVAVWAMTTKPT
jgi:hypothetical protein